MIRTIITTNDNILSFFIPDQYIGKKLEVIAFTLDEASEGFHGKEHEIKNFSALRLKTKGFTFNREDANER